MAAKVVWHGDDYRAKIHAEMERRIKACSILVLNHWKRMLNVEGTGKGPRTRDSKGKFKAVKLRYGANPSPPGEPPHKQTGRLIASTTFELDDLVGRVGTNLKYLLWLELGTRHMAARPSLRRALAECLPQVKAILAKPLAF